MHAKHPANKPWYVFRPDQLVRRCTNRGESLVLAWGLPLQIDASDKVGSSIQRTGVWDIAMTEAIFRLVTAGDRCVDIGGNVGYAASAMAWRAGPAGRVDIVEPNPSVSSVLQRNVDAWPGSSIAEIHVHEVAVSSARGQATLMVPDHASGASLTGGTSQSDGAVRRHRGIAHIVRTVRLDDVVSGPVGLLKLDVEGHELQVLHGAAALLERQMIRDIVFEEHSSPPTAVTELLASSGFAIFRLDQGLMGPRLVPDIAGPPPATWDAPNYIATSRPRDIVRIFGRRGWNCLRPRSRPSTPQEPAV